MMLHFHELYFAVTFCILVNHVYTSKPECVVQMELSMNRILLLANHNELCTCLGYKQPKSIGNWTGTENVLCNIKIHSEDGYLGLSAESMCACAGYKTGTTDGTVTLEVRQDNDTGTQNNNFTDGIINKNESFTLDPKDTLISKSKHFENMNADDELYDFFNSSSETSTPFIKLDPINSTTTQENYDHITIFGNYNSTNFLFENDNKTPLDSLEKIDSRFQNIENEDSHVSNTTKNTITETNDDLILPVSDNITTHEINFTRLLEEFSDEIIKPILFNSTKNVEVQLNKPNNYRNEGDGYSTVSLGNDFPVSSIHGYYDKKEFGNHNIKTNKSDLDHYNFESLLENTVTDKIMTTTIIYNPYNILSNARKDLGNMKEIPNNASHNLWNRLQIIQKNEAQVENTLNIDYKLAEKTATPTEVSNTIDGDYKDNSFFDYSWKPNFWYNGFTTNRKSTTEKSYPIVDDRHDINSENGEQSPGGWADYEGEILSKETKTRFADDDGISLLSKGLEEIKQSTEGENKMDIFNASLQTADVKTYIGLYAIAISCLIVTIIIFVVFYTYIRCSKSGSYTLYRTRQENYDMAMDRL